MTVRITREPGTTTGFLFTAPFAELAALTHCGDAACSPRHAVARHRHSGFELIYVSRGRAAWQIDGRAHHHGQGEVFFTLPAEEHASAPRPEPREYHHLWAGLDLERLGRDGQRLAARLRERRARVVAGCQELEPLLQGVVRRCPGAC